MSITKSIIQEHASHGVANRVPYVRIDNAVLSRWLADTHLDNIACLIRSGYRLVGVLQKLGREAVCQRG
jgi:hypothetical protein